jgi:hypothetical protein
MMKQIQVMLDRHFEGKPPLSHKWRVIKCPFNKNAIRVYHYLHLILVYDLDNHMVLYSWWEKPADKRGLESCLAYLKKLKEMNTMSKLKYDDNYVFATIKWSVADLAQVLEDRGIEPSQENITKFIEFTRGPKTLQDRSIEEGWSILDTIVDDLKHDGVFN